MAACVQVVYANKQHALEAIELYNGVPLDGKEMQLKLGAKPGIEYQKSGSDSECVELPLMFGKGLFFIASCRHLCMSETKGSSEFSN
eukprot:SAG31_NODE_26165_length_447_cov_0.885057_1_plen_86_part_01